jgi:Rrf2 family protein
MLKISKSVEYSIFALRQIHYNSSDRLLTAKDISEKENIPTELVAKLLQRMKKNGILESVQGKLGGYKFAIEPSQVSLYSITNAIDLDIQLTECLCADATIQNCGRIENCSLRDPFFKLQDEITTLMKKLKVTDLFN